MFTIDSQSTPATQWKLLTFRLKRLDEADMCHDFSAIARRREFSRCRIGGNWPLKYNSLLVKLPFFGLNLTVASRFFSSRSCLLSVFLHPNSTLGAPLLEWNWLFGWGCLLKWCWFGVMLAGWWVMLVVVPETFLTMLDASLKKLTTGFWWCQSLLCQHQLDSCGCVLQCKRCYRLGLLPPLCMSWLSKKERKIRN